MIKLLPRSVSTTNDVNTVLIEPYTVAVCVARLPLAIQGPHNDTCRFYKKWLLDLLVCCEQLTPGWQVCTFACHTAQSSLVGTRPFEVLHV
jgi:hypothetical protein